MIESFLAEVYKRVRSNQIGIIINGQNFSDELFNQLPKLRNKLKEIGEIKIAEILYENKISESDYQKLTGIGFSSKIIPGNIELSFLLDTYDLVLEKKVDILVLGTHSEDLIPLFTELRKDVSIFGLVEDIEKVSKGLIESFDSIIELDKIDEFTFNSASFNDLDQLLLQANLNSNNITSDYTGELTEVVDETNIGTISEDFIENDELLDEMKKENSS